MTDPTPPKANRPDLNTLKRANACAEQAVQGEQEPTPLGIIPTPTHQGKEFGNDHYATNGVNGKDNTMQVVLHSNGTVNVDVAALGTGVKDALLARSGEAIERNTLRADGQLNLEQPQVSGAKSDDALKRVRKMTTQFNACMAKP